MQLITLLFVTLPHVMLEDVAERRDVTGDDDDDVMAASRDVDASDSELAYRCCSLMRLQQLRTAAQQTHTDQRHLRGEHVATIKVSK